MRLPHTVPFCRLEPPCCGEIYTCSVLISLLPNSTAERPIQTSPRSCQNTHTSRRHLHRTPGAGGIHRLWRLQIRKLLAHCLVAPPSLNYLNFINCLSTVMFTTTDPALSTLRCLLCFTQNEARFSVSWTLLAQEMYPLSMVSLA